MRYRVTYLAGGEPATVGVEAPDAAAAVRAAQELADRGTARFELLAVVPARDPVPPDSEI